ncbi:MAG: host-nuclease inhibitor Gam family protein [Sphingomonadaceae bacterium]
MTTKRRKAAASDVPASREAAEALLRRFAELDAELEDIGREAEAEILRIRQEADAGCAQVKAEMKAIFNRLKPWWAVEHEEIAGKRRSAVLAGCEIGHRTGNPALVVPHGEADLIESLQLLGFDGWAVRVKRELDKPALIKALRGQDEGLTADDVAALAGLGLSVRQTETFFIARVQPQAPASECVAPGADAPVAGLEGGAA